MVNWSKIIIQLTEWNQASLCRHGNSLALNQKLFFFFFKDQNLPKKLQMIIFVFVFQSPSETWRSRGERLQLHWWTSECLLLNLWWLLHSGAHLEHLLQLLRGTRRPSHRWPHVLRQVLVKVLVSLVESFICTVRCSDPWEASRHVTLLTFLTFFIKAFKHL